MGRRSQKQKAGKLVLEGEVSIYQAQEIRERLQNALDQFAVIELDLSGVTELDTAGFQLLAQMKRDCNKAGKELRLTRHPPAVLEVFSLYGAEQHFGDPLLLSADDGTTNQDREDCQHESGTA